MPRSRDQSTGPFAALIAFTTGKFAAVLRRFTTNSSGMSAASTESLPRCAPGVIGTVPPLASRGMSCTPRVNPSYPTGPTLKPGILNSNEFQASMM